jgi:head-tail adaptor
MWAKTNGYSYNKPSQNKEKTRKKEEYIWQRYQKDIKYLL